MHLISASQITKFGIPDENGDPTGCERQWGWKYLTGLPDPSGPAAALGTECDDTQLQPYLRDATPIDFTRESGSGYIVAPGLAYLPKPKSPDIQLQKHFVIPSPTWAGEKHSGLAYQGYLDLWCPDGRQMPELAFDPKQFGPSGTQALEDGTIPPVVVDFKTTGNWKYAKNVAALAVDVQAQLYATWAMYFTGARVVDLVWVYFATKGKRQSKRTHLRVRASHVAEQFNRMNETALRMHAIKESGLHPLDLIPNPSICEKYPGNPCPYVHKCNLSPGQIIDAKAAQHWARQETSDMSNAPISTAGLLSGLRARKAGTSTPPPAVTPVTTTATLPTVAPVPLGINPPESLLPPAPPVGSVQAPVVSTTASVPEATATAPATPVAKRSPGRPKKVAPAPAPAATPVEFTETINLAAPSADEVAEAMKETPPIVSVIQHPEMVPPAATQTKPIGTVYLDCYPVGDNVEQAETLYRKVAERIQAEHGVPDYRLIDFKGVGIFAKTLGEVVEKEKIRSLVVDTRTPEGMIAKSVFVFRTGRVVQGLR